MNKFAVAVALPFLVSCGPGEEQRFQAIEHYWLGTTSVVSVFTNDEALGTKALEAAGNILQDIHYKMSIQEENTEIRLLNDSAGDGAWVSLSEETFTVLAEAQKVAQKSGGAFNPLIGPLVELWDITGDMPKVPDASSIEGQRTLVQESRIELAPENNSARLYPTGAKADVGAIAKGYAADLIAQTFVEMGIEKALLDLGGNVFAMGEKNEGTPWRAGIVDPLAESRSQFLGIVPLSSQTLVTSGSYERFFVEDGIRYHHILDATTGAPANSGLLSVSVFSENSMAADAWATALFVLGVEKGLELAEDENLAAIFVDDQRRIFTSSAVDGVFNLSSEDYQLLSKTD